MIAANRRSFLKLAVGTTLTMPALLRPALARATSVTVASLLNEDKPETKIWRHIQEQVEAKLPGRFRFNIVANGALGGEKEVAEASRLGSVHASLSTVSALSGWVPELQVLDLPFLFRDGDHLRRVVTGQVGADLREKLKAQNFFACDFIDYGARHLLTKEPAMAPEDIRGKRIRVIQSPLHTKLWSSYGAAPVGIPITETYNALSTGVADAMDLTKSAYAGFKLYEVVPYLTETAHIRASGVVYFSATFWNRLNAQEQEVLSAAAQSGAHYFNQLMTEDELRSMETAKQNGGHVLQPQNLEAWRQGAQSVWQDFASAVGGMEKISAIAAS